VSKEALDQLIRRAVADGAFRAKLLDKERVASATEGYDLTPDEVERLRRMALESSSATFPFAQDLSERLSK